MFSKFPEDGGNWIMVAEPLRPPGLFDRERRPDLTPEGLSGWSQIWAPPSPRSSNDFVIDLFVLQIKPKNTQIAASAAILNRKVYRPASNEVRLAGGLSWSGGPFHRRGQPSRRLFPWSGGYVNVPGSI